jgi:hypothetical protein
VKNPHWCVNNQLQISFTQLFLLSWVCNQFGASQCHLLRPQQHTQLFIFASNLGLAHPAVACGPKSLNQFVVTSEMSAFDFDLHNCRNWVFSPNGILFLEPSFGHLGNWLGPAATQSSKSRHCQKKTIQGLEQNVKEVTLYKLHRYNQLLAL